MNRRERADDLEIQIEESIALLEDELQQGHTAGFMELLEFHSKFHKYSLGNCILIAAQKPNATYCAGFRTWQKLGHSVRQGESALWVRAPMLKKQKDENGQDKEVLIGYIAVPVFDASQVEPTPEVSNFTRPIPGDWDVPYLGAKIQIGSTGILVVEEPLPNGIHGLSSGQKITINSTLSVSEKFTCLLHELAHEKLHQGEDRAETNRRQRELEAESVAFLLARLYGLTNPYSRDYILHWKGSVEKLHESLTRITLCVKECAKILQVDTILDLAEAA